MIVDNKINVSDAAEHYSSAHRRGFAAGKLNERNRLADILQDLLDNGPYNVETKVGIQIALAKVMQSK